MTKEPDHLDTGTLIEITGILTPEALAYAFDTVQKYFADHRDPQPPLPQLTEAILPCDLLITSKEDENGEDVGRIQFKRIDGTVIFDEKWVIRKSS